MKTINFILLFLYFFFQVSIGLAASFTEPLTARAAILIEASTGKVLYEKDADSRQYPASTTKMATVLAAMDNVHLEDTVLVSANAAQTEGSSMRLKAGDRIKVKDLLYGIMLESANDGTVALAEHIAGSVPAFAEKMNQKAKEIGVVHTNFVNSSGLPDENHYTTAHDLARIAAYGLKQPLFREIVSTKYRTIWWVGTSRSAVLENTNELLGVYPGCIGVKTGYTKAAGDCLVAAAERDGVCLIAVVLHSDDRWQETSHLLDYGFDNVKAELAYTKEELAGNVRVHFSDRFAVPVMPEREVKYPVSDADRSLFSIAVALPSFVEAPLQKGIQVGSIQVLYCGREIDRIPVVTMEQADKGVHLLSMIVSLFDYFLLAVGLD